MSPDKLRRITKKRNPEKFEGETRAKGAQLTKTGTASRVFPSHGRENREAGRGDGPES